MQSQKIAAQKTDLVVEFTRSNTIVNFQIMKFSDIPLLKSVFTQWLLLSLQQISAQQKKKKK